jgi:hypothetical protein
MRRLVVFRKNNRRIVALLIMLGLSTLSCQAVIPDWGVALAELCEFTGGTWINKEPDGLIEDDPYCDRADAQDDGTNKDVSPLDEPGQDTASGDGVDNDVFAGTYEGSTDLPGSWAEFPGEDIANEIIVIVADDGTVTGSLTVIRVGDAYNVPDGDCTTYTDFDVSGSPGGQLTDVSGTIEIQMLYFFETRYTGGCSSETVEKTETYDLLAEVHITGDRMTGTVPDFFTFEATKY